MGCERWRPDAASCKADGFTPLHYSFIHEASDAVVLALLEAPGAKLVRDDSGKTILHYATEFQSSVRVVRTVLHLWPNSIEIANKDGQTALHLALMHAAPLEVVQVLLDACPNEAAIMFEDTKGNTPLHTALAEKAQVVCVQELL